MKRYLILTLLLAGSQLQAAAEVGQLHEAITAQHAKVDKLHADIKEKKRDEATPAAQTGPQQRAMLMLDTQKNTMRKVADILKKHEDDPGKAKNALSRLRERTDRDIRKLQEDIDNYEKRARKANNTVDVCKKGDAAARMAGLEAGKRVIDNTHESLRTEPFAAELPPAPVPVG